VKYAPQPVAKHGIKERASENPDAVWITDMTGVSRYRKSSPESVARAILAGGEKGEDEIFPDPMSESMAEGWRSGVAKALERENAALVQAEPFAA
jgi:hypothetical protein